MTHFPSWAVYARAHIGGLYGNMRHYASCVMVAANTRGFIHFDTSTRARACACAPLKSHTSTRARAFLAALVGRDALASMEHLDRARGDAKLDLGANQGVRNRVEEVMDLDVIIEVDSRAPPFRELPILCRQAVERGALDLLEQFAPAQAEMAHGALVHALHDEFDGLVAFCERKEGLRAQSPENIGLSKSDAGLDFRLVPRLSGPRWKDSNRVMRRHRAVGAVDLGIVERSLVDAALQIVGNQQFRDAAEEAEHAHMRAGPIR